jgi:hypothetical protein
MPCHFSDSATVGCFPLTYKVSFGLHSYRKSKKMRPQLPSLFHVFSLFLA